MPDFPFHFQNTATTYCGPACIMMMLESQMERLPVQPVDFVPQQAILFNLVRSKCGSKFAQSGCGYFYSSPDGLAAVASEQLAVLDPQGTLGLSYGVFPDPPLAGSPPTEDEFTAAIRNSLDTTKAPVFALMRSGRHWILVYGWSGNPGARFYSIRWPSRKGSSDQPHQAHDTVCTTCGESADTAVSEVDLIKDLLPVLNVHAGDWAGQTILVTPRINGVLAAQPAADQPAQPAAEPAQPAADQPAQPIPEQPAQPMEAPDESGDPEEADTEASTEASTEARAQAMSREEAQLKKAQSIKQIPEGSQTFLAKPLPLDEVHKLILGRLPTFIQLFENHIERLSNEPVIGVPVFVEHLDDPAESYYLAPVFPREKTPEPKSSGESSPFLLAQINATTGRLQRVEAATTKGEGISGTYSQPFWVYVALAAEVIMEKLASTTGRESAASLKPTNKLVWKPCRQSMSPFQPFHELTDGHSKQWMDVFGTIHTHLDSETDEGG